MSAQVGDERNGCLISLAIGAQLILVGYVIGINWPTAPGGDLNPFGIVLMFIDGILILGALLVFFSSLS